MGSTTPTDHTLPYWQVNVSPSERQAQCPAALRDISEKDVGILSTPDSSYRPFSWPVVKQIIEDNRIHCFRRKPSELRRYLCFANKIRQKYGSVLNFIIKERVRWGREGDMVVKGNKPFEAAEDVKILRNDWPYGIDPRIVHLVVWTKFELVDDPATGYLTDAARAEIDEYVNKTFAAVCGADNVRWFKNWANLKSVKGLEHFHVMLFDPDMGFVDRITGGDQTWSRVVQDEES